MIHAHELQNALLSGPHTTQNDNGVQHVPVLVEVMLPTGPQLVPVRAVRAKRKDGAAYILSIDATGLVLRLAERVAGQSEALGKRAERAEGKTINVKEGSGY